MFLYTMLSMMPIHNFDCVCVCVGIEWVNLRQREPNEVEQRSGNKHLNIIIVIIWRWKVSWLRCLTSFIKSKRLTWANAKRCPYICCMWRTIDCITWCDGEISSLNFLEQNLSNLAQNNGAAVETSLSWNCTTYRRFVDFFSTSLFSLSPFRFTYAHDVTCEMLSQQCKNFPYLTESQNRTSQSHRATMQALGM